MAIITTTSNGVFNTHESTDFFLGGIYSSSATDVRLMDPRYGTSVALSHYLGTLVTQLSGDITGTVTGFRFDYKAVAFLTITGLYLSAETVLNLVGGGTVVGLGTAFFAGDDIFYGQEHRAFYGAQEFNAFGGNDLVYGSLGNDTLSCGTGRDTLYGGFEGDTLHGDFGSDLVYGDAGNDLMYGEAGNDTLYGGWDNDTISGGAWADVLEGGLGVDRIIGGGGGRPSEGRSWGRYVRAGICC